MLPFSHMPSNRKFTHNISNNHQSKLLLPPARPVVAISRFLAIVVIIAIALSAAAVDSYQTILPRHHTSAFSAHPMNRAFFAPSSSGLICRVGKEVVKHHFRRPVGLAAVHVDFSRSKLNSKSPSISTRLFHSSHDNDDTHSNNKISSKTSLTQVEDDVFLEPIKACIAVAEGGSNARRICPTKYCTEG